MIILFAVFTSTCFILVYFIKYVLLVYGMLVNGNGIYIIYMYVKKCVELAHREIPLYKIYVLLLLLCNLIVLVVDIHTDLELY